MGISYHTYACVGFSNMPIFSNSLHHVATAGIARRCDALGCGVRYPPAEQRVSHVSERIWAALRAALADTTSRAPLGTIAAQSPCRRQGRSAASPIRWESPNQFSAARK